MRRRTRVAALAVLILSLLPLAGCGAAKKEAAAAFEKECEIIELQTEKLQEAIENGQRWLDSGKEPLDARVRTALEQRLEEAKAFNVEIPEMPKKTEDIVAATEKLKEQDAAKLLG